MRILLVGAGGVGGGVRPDRGPPRVLRAWWWPTTTWPRAEQAVAGGRRRPVRRGAGRRAPTRRPSRALLAEHRCDVLLNATDPRFVMPLFRAALAAGAHYLDMAMSLSQPASRASRTSRPA